MNSLIDDRELSVKDDRVLRITRWSGYVIAPVLFLAFISLYGFPSQTAVYFAWTINPDLTPLIMGAGYGAGTYFFYRVVTVNQWHRVHALFPGIAVFTLAMGIATVLHWDVFNPGHGSTWLWVILYIVTPVLIPILWVVNGRVDPGPPSQPEVQIPLAIRWVSGFVGGVLTLALLIVFALPEYMITHWPWAVSPLTTRVLVGWAAVFSVVSLVIALETRWTAAKIPIESLVIWFGLILIGFLRSWNDVDPRNPILWVLLGGISIYLIGLSALYIALER